MMFAGAAPIVEKMLTPRGVVLAALLYAGVNAAITLSMGPALALDEVKLNVFTQSLQAGYLPDNPPLFEWTLIAAQRLVGPTLASFVMVKAVYLAAALLFTFLAVTEATGQVRTGAAAAFLLPLLPPVGVSFHQTLTHSTALVAAIAFFWFALLRLRRRKGLADYALLGAAIGIGLLSKYSFALAAALSLAAALARPEWRRVLATPGAFIAACIALTIAAPHLSWLVTSSAESLATAQERLISGDSYLDRVVQGLLAVIWAVASFFTPIAVAAFLVARRPLQSLLRAERTLLFDSAAWSAVVLIMAVLMFGVSNIQERYAIPFFYSGYLWVVIGLCQGAPAARSIPALVAVSAVFVLVFASARMAEAAAPGRPFCNDCRHHIPYDYLQDVPAPAPGTRDTLVGFDDNTAGNLRRLFPQARVVSSHQPFYSPPADQSGACYFIWSTDVAPSPPHSVLEQIGPPLSRFGGEWRRRLRGEAGPRTTYWSVAAINRGTPLANALCRD
ncbi:MAG: glycosyltransferase family 39 protein [Parvularculaceae bacterium]|nr:glycosyltransferase family 39 protein [Parvularculaceae bacterium]